MVQEKVLDVNDFILAFFQFCQTNYCFNQYEE